MRILIAPLEISGFYRALNAGFREIGVDSTFAELWPHPYAYSGEEPAVQAPISWARALARRYRAASRPLQRTWWLFLGGLVRVIVFLWALLRFDVFVFGFGATILHFPAFELLILWMLRKTIVFHFHGSDSRPPYMDGYMGEADKSGRRHDFARLSRKVKKRVSRIDRYANLVVDSPLSSHFHTRTCVNGFEIGVASVDAVAKESTDNTSTQSASVRILHAPSNLAAKGTQLIREAVEMVRARGLALEYVEIVGQSNDRVVEEMRRCDFVVDQLYSDTPMAGFAAEAARAGKPAIVCGYASEQFRRWIPADRTPPSHYTHPSELVAAIERMATDVAYRKELGARARRFFESRCLPKEVAARYLCVIRGEGPAGWMFDPQSIDYLQGCGLDESTARDRIRRIVELHGATALQLDDKPALLRAMRRFAFSEADADISS